MLLRNRYDRKPLAGSRPYCLGGFPWSKLSTVAEDAADMDSDVEEGSRGTKSTASAVAAANFSRLQLFVIQPAIHHARDKGLKFSAYLVTTGPPIVTRSGIMGSSNILIKPVSSTSGLVHDASTSQYCRTMDRVNESGRGAQLPQL